MRIEIKCAHPSWMVRPMVVYAGGCREYCDLCKSGASDDGPAIAYFDIPDETVLHARVNNTQFQNFKPIVP